jgi:hypothetical protein
MNKQIWEAALWTFLEAFLATIGPAIVGVTVGDWNALGSIAASAGISALAATLSFVKSWYISTHVGETDSIFINE